ncbi:hypothetical protein CB1_000706031 [Camelus ferus]|nr:hypothetical protein CB1_000706031 [Camelus ferus]
MWSWGRGQESGPGDVMWAVGSRLSEGLGSRIQLSADKILYDDTALKECNHNEEKFTIVMVTNPKALTTPAPATCHPVIKSSHHCCGWFIPSSSCGSSTSLCPGFGSHFCTCTQGSSIKAGIFWTCTYYCN